MGFWGELAGLLKECVNDKLESYMTEDERTVTRLEHELAEIKKQGQPISDIDEFNYRFKIDYLRKNIFPSEDLNSYNDPDHYYCRLRNILKRCEYILNEIPVQK